MADRDEIISFCNDLLEIGKFDDYGPNGLQVPGRQEVRKVVTGVSAHRALIEQAISDGADLLIAHHGLFWDFHPRALTTQMADRLRAALVAHLSVASYHLPLDAHPEIGNNALLRDALDLDPAPGSFGLAKGRPIGVVGRSEEGVAAAEMASRLAALTGREALVQGAGPKTIRSVGIVTGAGASMIHEAVALGLDALITGEAAEHAMADAEEGGIHFFAAGHYATETLGVRRLGDLIAERFGVEHEFVDIANPV